MTLSDLTLTVDDPVPPQARLGGALVAAGWHRGNVPVEVASEDPVGAGVYRDEATVDGASVLATRLQERLPQSLYQRPLLGTGFCGAYTTFSTMQLELVQMIDRDRYALAGSYAVCSVLAGVLAIYAGTLLVRRTWPAR